MKFFFALVAFCIFLHPGYPAGAETAEPSATAAQGVASKSTLSTREIVDALSDADVVRVLPLLRQNYIGAEKLGELDVARATVQGLVDRLAPGVFITDALSRPQESPSPFRSEIIDHKVGYLRVGSLQPENVVQLDGALAAFAEKVITAVVLDLRATTADGGFEQAAEVCKRFCPKGKVLFTLKRANAKDDRMFTSREEPRYQGILAVLTERRITGAAEVIAAVLRLHAGAMVIGETTRGEAAEFNELALPSGKSLRVAVGKVELAAGVSIFPNGLKPDLAVPIPPTATDAVLKAALEKGVQHLVADVERPRMNEAALVAGTNPELDAHQAAQNRRGEASIKPLRDVVLQRALDFITTITVYKQLSK